jgi:hypothetical protein
LKRIFTAHICKLHAKRIGFHTDKVGNEDNHLRLGKTADMSKKRSAWNGSDLDFLQALILTVVVRQGLIA